MRGGRSGLVDGHLPVKDVAHDVYRLAKMLSSGPLDRITCFVKDCEALLDVRPEDDPAVIGCAEGHWFRKEDLWMLTPVPMVEREP